MQTKLSAMEVSSLLVHSWGSTSSTPRVSISGHPSAKGDPLYMHWCSEVVGMWCRLIPLGRRWSIILTLSGFNKGPLRTLTFGKDMITCKGSVSEEKKFLTFLSIISGRVGGFIAMLVLWSSSHRYTTRWQVINLDCSCTSWAMWTQAHSVLFLTIFA